MENTETSADAPLVADGDRPRRRWLVPTVLAPVVLLVVLVIAWTVDSGSGEVARNVHLAGVDIGGLTEDELAGPVGDVASDFSATPVELAVGDATYRTTASAIGLMVDEEQTASSALDVGESSFLLVRPFGWALSLLSERQAPLQLRVNAELVASTVVELEGDDRTPPTEPTVELVDGAFTVVPGDDGHGLDPAEVARRLPGMAEAAVADGEGVIRLDLSRGPIPPLGSEEEARQAASDAEALVSEPVEIRTPGGTRMITPEQLRSWVRLASDPDGSVLVTFDQAKAAAGLRAAFADIDGHPVDASFTLEGGVPVIRPDQPGKVCCGDTAAATILASLQGGSRSVELPLVDGPASFTVAEAEAYGIKQAVGGNHAWRNGAATTAEPGFTTYHDATGARIINIHRIADLVRGAVVPPGASFSINYFVGKRTEANGFVSAGAIANGEHVNEVGGGISQFATTTFNAAYFAGLDVDAYQAHSEYFDRYPRGREATMGYPLPDLKFTNNTPYGIMIWTSYTQTSLTVTMYSTPYATAEQTGISEAPAGRCTRVTTIRTRTFPDGHTDQQRFSATYRPGEGERC
jgi:vancomycin resistance protein YoaR